MTSGRFLNFKPLSTPLSILNTAPFPVAFTRQSEIVVLGTTGCDFLRISTLEFLTTGDKENGVFVSQGFCATGCYSDAFRTEQKLHPSGSSFLVPI
eukprot:4594897-Amphidinium_carterae.1